MRTSCPTEDHFNKPLTLVCINPKCQDKRLLCLKCLTLDHRDCLDYVLEIDDIRTCSFMQNINWIRNDEVKQAIRNIHKHNLTKTNGQLALLFEEIIEKEFSKITEHFLQKIQEVKDKILFEFRSTSGHDQIDLDEFNRQLQDLYNFDSFLGILDSSSKEEKSVDLLNKELESFLYDINVKEKQETLLIETAKKLNFFMKDYLQPDIEALENFKNSFKFNLLNGYPLGRRTRSWNPANKSSKILLKDHNAVALKDKGSQGMTAVVGNIEMQEGRYQWEIEIASNNMQNQWIVFGILEGKKERDYEALNYQETIGLSTFGQFYNLTKITGLDNYDNKTYLCDLDLYNDIFTVSHDGMLIAKVEKNFKNKKFLPFAILSREDNTAKIKMLTPV